jgi:hypothetical protein
MEQGSVIEIESIPGGYPQEVAGIAEEMVDGTVGKTITVIIVLQEIRVIDIRFCTNWRQCNNAQENSNLENTVHIAQLGWHKQAVRFLFCAS